MGSWCIIHLGRCSFKRWCASSSLRSLSRKSRLAIKCIESLMEKKTHRTDSQLVEYWRKKKNRRSISTTIIFRLRKRKELWRLPLEISDDFTLFFFELPLTLTKPNGFLCIPRVNHLRTKCHGCREFASLFPSRPTSQPLWHFSLSNSAINQPTKQASSLGGSFALLFFSFSTLEATEARRGNPISRALSKLCDPLK